MALTRVSGGWATLDCFRAQATYTNLNFLGRLQRLELNARTSKIGNGAPLSFARPLCPQLASDEFSDTLNYYVSATISQGALSRPAHDSGTRAVSASEGLNTRRFCEQMPIGIAATMQVIPRFGYPLALGCQVERGRTVAQPALFCALFSVCEDAARRTLLELRWQAVASAVFTRNRVDNLANPARGSLARFELRHASTTIGSDPGSSSIAVCSTPRCTGA